MTVSLSYDFFLSDETRQNKKFSLLVAKLNVIVTSHQAFFTHEALANIAELPVQRKHSRRQRRWIVSRFTGIAMCLVIGGCTA